MRQLVDFASGVVSPIPLATNMSHESISPRACALRRVRVRPRSAPTPRTSPVVCTDETNPSFERENPLPIVLHVDHRPTSLRCFLQRIDQLAGALRLGIVGVLSFG